MTQKTMPLPFNPRSAEFRANPYPTYHYLRTHHPIYYRPERKDWILTRYADIVEVLKSPSFGHSESGLTRSEMVATNQESILLSLRHKSQKLMKLWLLLRNPPEHTRLRNLFREHFSLKRIQTLRTYIQTKADALIEPVKESGKMDIINDFAYPLTIDVNCNNMLGISPQAWHSSFRQWAEELTLIADLDPTLISTERGLLAIAGLAEYFRNLIAKCRNDSELQDNLISILINAETNGQLSEEELLSHCVLLFFTGYFSSQHLIGIGILSTEA